MLELFPGNPREFVQHNAPSTENSLLLASSHYNSFQRILFAAIWSQAQPFPRVHEPRWIDRLEGDIAFKRTTIKRFLSRSLYPV
jgi:hypothetical protein